MASMLKKGSGSFRPKAPVARRRPGVGTASPALEHSVSSDVGSPVPSIDKAHSDNPAAGARSSIPCDTSQLPTPPSSYATTGSAFALHAAANATAVARNETVQTHKSNNSWVMSGPGTARSAAPETDAIDDAEAQTQLLAEATVARYNVPSVESAAAAEDTPHDDASHTPDQVVPSVETAEMNAQADTETAAVAPPKRSRKRKAPAPSIETAGNGDGDAAPKAKKRAPRKKKQVESDTPIAATEQGEANTAKAGPEPKRKRSSKKRAVAVTGASTENGEEDGATENVKPPPKKKPRKRSVTPEDAAERTIDHKEVKMGDLTKDMRIGIPFSKHAELRKRVSLQRSRDRLAKLGRLAELENILGIDDNTDNDDADIIDPASPSVAGTPAPVSKPTTTAAAPISLGPQLQLINGQIAIDPNSLHYDRHAAADVLNADFETVEENDWTRATNNATYMKASKKGPNPWSDEDTVAFYKHLRMFGTDLGTITRMFNGRKTRRQVKLKFNREERLNPDAINRCIVGTKKVAMDMDVVRECTGIEYEDSQVILDELERLKQEREDAHRREEEEIAEEARRKEREVFAGRKGSSSALGSKHRHAEALEGEAGDVVLPSVEEDPVPLPQPRNTVAGPSSETALASAGVQGRGKGRGKRPKASGFGA